jgi:hypothetical protein
MGGDRLHGLKRDVLSKAGRNALVASEHVHVVDKGAACVAWLVILAEGIAARIFAANEVWILAPKVGAEFGLVADGIGGLHGWKGLEV